MPKRSRRDQPAYDPMLSHGVLAIVLLLFAIIITLSFFGKAGTLGVILNEWILSFLFGSMRFFTPLVIVILAWYLVADTEYDYRPTHGIGAILFFIATSSLLHLRFPIDQMWAHALEGDGGGVFGMFAWVLKNYTGNIVPWFILLALILISVTLIFNTTILHFIDMHKRMMEKIGLFKEKVRDGVDTVFEEDDEEYEDEDEDEEEEDSRFKKRRLTLEEDEDDDDFDEEDDENDESAYADTFAKATASEDASADEDEEDEETSEDMRHPVKKPKVHTIPVEETVPVYLQNVIVRPLPTTKLLETRKGKPTTGDLKENERIIVDTFKEFRIDVDIEDVRVGPSVTQYALRPAKGVKLSRITSLSNDLALALAAHPIRIEAPIPGRSLVGIEVPNNKTAMVSLKELIQSKVFATRKHDLMIGLGKDVGGKVWFADLPRMPHLLIAGSTGSGKTVCMNTIITSLLYQNTAETLRMIMVDPKRVELTAYNGIPHLLTPVITDTSKTVNALKWTIGEMERRFEVLSKAGNRNIDTYNDAHPENKLPYIVFIIDELADLMATASNDVETGIIRIAQMARAVGIHLIVATQRPSVDVITGLMKANIPGRIAFSVASITDSRTILDAPGADKLIGKGDMLLMSSDYSKPVRIQGAFISEEETKRVIKHLQGKEKPVYDERIIDIQAGSQTSMFGDSQDDDQDPLFVQARSVILETGKASASFIQRKLKVGYARAARILDELEEAGVIGPANGAKPREVLITQEDLYEPTSTDTGQEFNVYKEEPKKSDSGVASKKMSSEDESAFADTSAKATASKKASADEEEEYDDEEEYDENEESEEEYDEDENDEEYEDEDGPAFADTSAKATASKKASADEDEYEDEEDEEYDENEESEEEYDEEYEDEDGDELEEDDSAFADTSAKATASKKASADEDEDEYEDEGEEEDDEPPKKNSYGIREISP